jgi:hypothetical protein
MRVLTGVLLLSLGWTGLASAQGGSVAFRVVLHRTLSRFAEPHDFVLRNEEQWCRFWLEAHGALLEPPPCDRSVVDFRHEIAIASTTGSRPSGCYDVHVAQITRARGARRIRVLVDESIPGANCGCTTAFVHPVEAVAVSKPVGPVEFVHRERPRDCSR